MGYRTEYDVASDILLFKAIQRAVARHLDTGERVGVYVTPRPGQCNDVQVVNEMRRHCKDEGVGQAAQCYGVAWNGAFYFTPEKSDGEA